MRRAPTFLLLAIALCAPGACFAQAQSLPDAPASPDPDIPATDARNDAPRSPFGKVMAVMIAALQQQTEERSRPVAPVRTTAAGTPMDIEIGTAFRDAMPGRSGAGERQAARTHAGTGGVAAANTPRAAPPEPEDVALRQSALAGPD